MSQHFGADHKHLTLELVTPEKVAWSAPADFVVLPAAGGEMGVLPGHQSFLVQLMAGEVRVTVGEEVKSFAVSGGFAEIKNDTVSLFAETAEDAGRSMRRAQLRRSRRQRRSSTPASIRCSWRRWKRRSAAPRSACACRAAARRRRLTSAKS